MYPCPTLMGQVWANLHFVKVGLSGACAKRWSGVLETPNWIGVLIEHWLGVFHLK